MLQCILRSTTSYNFIRQSSFVSNIFVTMLNAAQKNFVGWWDKALKKAHWANNSQEEYLFVFLGTQESGKTNVIQRIFASMSDFDWNDVNVNQVLAIERHNEDKKQCILDVSPFHSSINFEYNERLISSLNQFLKEKDIAPTVLFITERIDQDRFAGDSSEYVQRLHLIFSLDYFKNLGTCCNVILLLTNADSPVIREDDKIARRKAFLEVFKNVFHKYPVCILLENPINSYEDMVSKLEEELKNSLVASYVFYQLFLLYLKNQQSNSMKQMFLAEAIPISKFIKPGPMEPCAEDTFDNLYTEQTNAVFMRDLFMVKPVCDDLASKFADGYEYTLLTSDSKILLHNNEKITPGKCAIGQKVKNRLGQISIVTNVVKYHWSLEKPGSKNQFGRIFIKQKANVNTQPESGKSNPSQVLEPQSRHFTKMYYYYIELNGETGCFSVDDIDYISKRKVHELQQKHELQQDPTYMQKQEQDPRDGHNPQQEIKPQPEHEPRQELKPWE